jgi:hypothetical protein
MDGRLRAALSKYGASEDFDETDVFVDQCLSHLNEPIQF